MEKCDLKKKTARGIINDSSRESKLINISKSIPINVENLIIEDASLVTNKYKPFSIRLHCLN